MGGKFRSLKNIIPNFGEDIDTFYDVFSGSGTIHLNVKANNVIANDIHYIIMELQEYIAQREPKELYKELLETSETYNLVSDDSEGYLKLRAKYNEDKNMSNLLALSQHAFNYIIRFNKKGGFNTAHGKGICKLSQDFLQKLINFHEQSKLNNTTYKSKDFRELIDWDNLSPKDLVYCDPPYLLSEAVYNEKRAFGGWSEGDTLDLFKVLDKVNDAGSRFALTEMIESKGKQNTKLIEWIEEKGYVVRYNNVKYLGVPSTHDNNKKSVEVLVTNY